MVSAADSEGTLPRQSQPLADPAVEHITQALEAVSMPSASVTRAGEDDEQTLASAPQLQHATIIGAQPSQPSQPSLPSLLASNPSSPSPSAHPHPLPLPIYEPPTASVDETILGALKNSRDRVFYMQHEREMALFVRDAARQRLDLPLMNTYQRLLVHRCADQFNLSHQLDPATKAVTLTKTMQTRMPEQRISQKAAALLGSDREPASGKASPTPQLGTPPCLASSSSSSSFASAAAGPASSSVSAIASPVSASATPPSGFRIMRRNPTAGSRGSLTPAASTSGSNSDSERSDPIGSGGKHARKDRKNMTIEEREAAYKAARERIFGAAEPADAPAKGDDKKSAVAAASQPASSSASNGSTGGGGGGAGKRKGAGGGSGNATSVNGSTDAVPRGRAATSNRKAADALPVDDDLLGYSRNMVPPAMSNGLWRPHGQAESSPQSARQSNSKEPPLYGFPVISGGPAIVRQDGYPLVMPHYATSGPPAAAMSAMPTRYGYLPADTTARYGGAMPLPQQQQQQARFYYGGQADRGGARAGAAAAASQPHMRAKAPAFLPPSSQGPSGRGTFDPETASSKGGGPSTPAPDGSHGSAGQRLQQPGGGGYYLSSNAPQGSDHDFSPFPPSNPSSAGGSRSASTSSSAGHGIGTASTSLSNDQFPALPGAPQPPCQAPSPVSAWKSAATTDPNAQQGAWDAGVGKSRGPSTGGSNVYPSGPTQNQWAGNISGSGTWQQQPPFNTHGQRPVAAPATAALRGPDGYGVQTGPGWNPQQHAHAHQHLQGHGRYPRAGSSSSDISVTSTTSSCSSQPINPTLSSSDGVTMVSHPSLPSKPSWIHKNGSGNETGTPLVRPVVSVAAGSTTTNDLAPY